MSSVATKPAKPIIPVIIKSWLVAGTLDISIACLQYYINKGKGPSGVLKFVASGFFDKTAFTGGIAMAVYGLMFHFLVALIWTIIFFFIYPRISFLRIHICLSAFIYGFFVWLIMNRVVLPLSAAPALPFDPVKALTAMLILVVAIGFPLSYFAKRYYSGK